MPDFKKSLARARLRAHRTLGLGTKEISKEEWGRLLEKGTALDVLEKELKNMRELSDGAH